MKQNIRLGIILLGVTTFIVSLNAQNTWQSNLVQIDTVTGELSYAPDTVSGIRIPDFSRAGYKGGGVSLPTVPVKLTIDPISGDNTLHIQNAIDSVSSLPLDSNGFRGALLLNSGVYRVYGTLKITTSGVVLRGTGRGLDSLSNTLILGLGNTPANRTIIKMGGLNNTKFSGMVPGTQTNIISPIVKVGDKKFRVANVSPFQVGDNIIIRHPCTQAWLDAIDGGGTDTDPDWAVGSQPIIYNTRIKKIELDTIFTNSPVFNTLDMSLSQSYIYKYDRAGLVENVGLENLRIDIEYNQNDPNDANHAKSAVLLSQVENAWVSGCEFLHFWYAGVDMQTANYVTIQDCHAYSPKGPTTGGHKYNFCVSKATQNSLFTNCEASEGRHAFVSNGTSSVAGVVFHKCTSIDPHTSSEGHRRWTTGLLFDNFVDMGSNPGRVLALYNRGHWGSGHGWSAANSVAWNCDVTRAGTDGKIVIQRPPTAQNFAIGCKGIVTGNGPYTHPAGYIEGANSTDSLIPNSLYEAQLIHRAYIEALPIELLSLNAYSYNDHITLKWVTGSEMNNSGFKIQKSKNRKDWFDVDFVNGQGTTGQLNRYEYIDKNPFRGISYYRLKQIDFDGTFKYSNIVSVSTRGEEKEIEIYPNPTNGKITIDAGAFDFITDVQVFNSIGQVIGQYKFEKSKIVEINIVGESGYYFVNISTLKNRESTIKIIKK